MTMRLLSTHHVNRTRPQLTGLLALIAMLDAMAVIGMAYVVGLGPVKDRLEHAHGWWLAPALGAVALGFCGYYVAYRGIESVEHGPELDRPALLAVVTAGFGGFLAHGGTALDELAMRAGGADEREAKLRIGALTGFEHGVLALIVSPAAVAALVAGGVIPRADFTWPWAIIPLPASVLVIWLAERYRERLRDRDGWRGALASFFDIAHLLYAAVTRPGRHRWAVLGMALYWAADMFALWATTAAFGFRMTFLAVIVAFGTGMLFTRRTAPLAGAGIMVVALVPTLWYGAAVPFASATLGVATYRFLTVWTQLPASLAAIPKLRELGRTGEGTSGRRTRADKGEPALEHRVGHAAIQTGQPSRILN